VKAIVYRSHGGPDVLRYEEIEKPSPGDADVLIRVRAAAINPLDWRLMRGVPLWGLGKAKVHRPGRDVAGVVEAVGRKVTRFEPGDEVFGTCRGAFAEYACAPESTLAVKSGRMTFEQAASLPVAGLTALQALRDKGRIRPGHEVLINGASGGVGTFAVQIAKSFGAHVTGVCSTGNSAMVRSLGADRVIDYTREDFTSKPERYGLFLDCVGNCPLAACRRVLSPGGTSVVIGAPKEMWRAMGHAAWLLVASWFVPQRVVVCVARMNAKDLAILADLMEAGKMTPAIDRRFRLSEAAEAFRHLEAGHARGKVVITP
jgi:NADPH:quinone reductase-like Zn-dependent oxidoreductase